MAWRRSNLVQQGGELAYLIRHDPEFRGVRREHLIEAGRRVRLRSDIPALVDVPRAGHRRATGSPSSSISAAPREVVLSALDGIVAARSHLRHRARATSRDRARCARSGACRRATARWPCSTSWRHASDVAPDRTIYVGDGSSDVHVMLHVNNRDGFTIAVSENKQLVAHREAHGAERQRVQRAGADARADRRLAAAGRSASSSSRTA